MGPCKWSSLEMLHFNEIPDCMAPPILPGTSIEEETQERDTQFGR